MNRAMAKCQAGNCREALPDCEKALKIDPGYSAGYGVRGYVNYELGDYSRAEEDFKKTVELSPSNWDAFFGLALVSERSGEFAAADAWIKKAMELEPGIKKGAAFLEGLESEGYFYTPGQKETLLALIGRNS